MTPEERNRGRLAKSFSAFWDGGAGPTHGDLVSIFAQFEFPEDAIQGSKKDRVGAAVRHARDDELLALVDELLDSLRRASNVFDLPRPDADPWKRDVEQLGKALAAYGLHLTDEGDLDRNATALPLRPADKLPDVPALREHIHRLDIAAQHNDIPLLLGTSKELLETTCKVVLDVVDVVAVVRGTNVGSGACFLSSDETVKVGRASTR